MTDQLQLIQTKLKHLARMQRYLAYSLGKPKGAYIAASTDMAVAVFLALWVAWRESRRHATGRAACPIVRQNQQMLK